MKWSLNELKQTADEPLMFEETLDLKDNLMSRRKDLLDVAPVYVKGVISLDSLGLCAYVKVKAMLKLPSSRSLEPADLSLDFDFTEHYVSQHEHDLSRFEDTDVVIVMQNDILDLDSAVGDNILLQIPMQVLTEAERNSEVQLPQGEQWTVMSESQLSTSRKDEDGVDPRLAKLKDFFDNSQKNSQD